MKKTKEQFTEEAKLIHGDKYDYSKVEYKNNRTPVKIICKEHGAFEQTPYNHLSGQGCSKCFGNTRKTKEQFIEKAISIWGKDKYDYSLVEYKNNHTKVKIICKEHGMFEQSPKKHYLGEGCSGCQLQSKGEGKIENFFKKKNISFESQKKYNDLRDERFLSYDFFLEEHNLLIEYNGIQHYKNVFEKPIHEFHRQLHHDWMKRRYAKINKINLLVIPYWEFDNIEKILEEI